MVYINLFVFINEIFVYFADKSLNCLVRLRHPHLENVMGLKDVEIGRNFSKLQFFSTHFYSYCIIFLGHVTNNAKIQIIIITAAVVTSRDLDSNRPPAAKGGFTPASAATATL